MADISFYIRSRRIPGERSEGTVVDGLVIVLNLLTRYSDRKRSIDDMAARRGLRRAAVFASAQAASGCTLRNDASMRARSAAVVNWA